MRKIAEKGEKEKEKMAKILNHKNNSGNTCLHDAEIANNPDVVMFLI